MISIDRIRQRVALGTTVLLWFNLALLVVCLATFSAAPALPLGVAGLVVCVLWTAAWRLDRTGTRTRWISGFVQAVMVALLVSAFVGSPLQIDMHLYFFAVLAMCAGWIDWRPLVAFAGFTAVHHLGVELTVPLFVFPGDASIMRVLLHAAILVLETGVLIAICNCLQGYAKAEAAFAEALTAQKEAARLTEEAAQERARSAEEAARQVALHEARATELVRFVTQIELGFTRLADGDLTVRMTESLAPDYETVRSKFNDSVAKLDSAVAGVAALVTSLRSGLGEIRTASDDLARRTEKQAATIEETVASLSEVTSGVVGTANEAGKAQEIAAKAQNEAENGGEIVSRTVSAMHEIEASSEKIGKIIGVIDEIAFQTSLLALNAGVEAARAGEAGRGFAVVAQEVRGLAQRSAEAAKEIKSLISTSTTHVENGVELARRSGDSLSSIVLKVQEMSRAIGQIAESARHQSTNLREVSAAADEMDKVTQQNAAMVEETTAAAHSLSGETEGLARLMQTFRTGAGHAEWALPAAHPSATLPTRPTGPVVQLRSTGRGTSALATLANDEGWSEF